MLQPGEASHPTNGVKAATCDPATIQKWWKDKPEANVAIATGAVSGIVVLDIDSPKGGRESLTSLFERYGKLPTSPYAKTGSGGFHLLFGHPGRPVHNRIGLAQGINVRADGGYIVAPPSRNKIGPYSWGIAPGNGCPFPPIPEGWLLALTFASDTQSTQSTQSTHEGAEHTGDTGDHRRSQEISLGRQSTADDVRGMIADAIKLTIPSEAGSRHRTLFEFARHLKGIPALADCTSRT